MRNTGFVMLLLGAAMYWWCGQEALALEPVPKGVDAMDALKHYPMARMEVGRFVGMGLGASGLLLVLMPTGRA